VTVAGTLARPQNFQTNQGTEFDYVSYLGKDNILYVMQNATLISHTRDTSITLTKILYAFRHNIESKLSKYLPNVASGFVEGILLGTKTAIDQDLYDALIRTSTVHIIALSGYNVSVVAEGISKTLGMILPPVVASIAGAVGIVLFVIMTGGSSTAIRAGCMALLMLFSKVFGRPAHSFRIVALATLGLVIYNPMYLVSDLSFQLSFLALLGLMIVSPTYISWLLKVRFLPKICATLIGETLAAETAVAPFVIYKMGIFSVVSLPVNIVILPFIPFLMLAGFILVCVGFFLPTLGYIVGGPVGAFAKGFIWVIQTAAAAPWAAAVIPQIPLFYILFFYILTTWFFLCRNLTK
jgi:competence protein ComEC